MNIRSLVRGRHARLEANLDAYIDGALDPATHRRLEAHIEGCDSCKLRTAGSRRLRLAMAALPELPAPRSFAITEAMLEKPSVAAPARSGAWTGAMRSMQGIAAAGIAVFAILTFADLSGGTAATSSDDAQRTSLASDAQANDTRDNGSANSAAGGDDGNTYDNSGKEGAATAAIVPPATPPPGGVGAQANPRPTTTEELEPGDTAAPDSASGTLPESSDMTGEEIGPESQVALYADEDGGGSSRLRFGELLAAGVAVLAIGGFLITRRLAPPRER